MLPVRTCPFERGSGLVDIDQQLIHRPANPLLPDDLRNSPVLLLPALPLSLAGVLAFHYAVLHLRRPGAISDGLREDAMAQHEAWQVGGSAAELYQRYLVPAIASLWAADLIDRAAPRPGERVLDVACGTGVVSRLAAARMGSGRVGGLDINAGMLAVARSLIPSAGPSIEWYEGS